MKKFLCIEVLFIIAVLFSGCGFHPAKPERFGIKTSDEAVYNLAISDKSYELGQFFSIDKFLKDDDNEESESGQSEDEKPKYEIFEYDPERNDNKIQQYLLKMDLQKIPLDLGESLEGTEITTNIDNMGFSKEMEIPVVNKTEEKEVDLNVNKKINAFVTISGTTQAQKQNIQFNFGSSGNGFDSISYESGTMRITKMPEAVGTITGDVILYQGDVPLKRASFVDGVASLSLEEVTIEERGVVLEFTESSGIDFLAIVDEDSVVKSARNLSVGENIPITLHQEIAVGNVSSNTSENSDKVESYTIGNGNLTVAFNLPEEWKNNGVTYEYTMNLYGLREDKILSETNTDCSLDDSEFSEGSKLTAIISDDPDVEGDGGYIKLTNANLDFRKEVTVDGETTIKSITPTITVDVEVSNIKSATIKLHNKIELPELQNSSLPQSVLDNVKSILWDKYGFSISCINTLPRGNPITIECTSDFFNLEEIGPVTLPNTYPAEDVAEPVAVELSNFINETTSETEYRTFIGEEPGQFTSVDVTPIVHINGYDEENRTITMEDLTPGQTYTIDIKVTPVLDWQSMEISTKDRHEDGKMSTGLNLSSIFGSLEETVGEDVADNLKFSRIPIYLFAEAPKLQNDTTNQKVQEFFDSVTFNGVIKAYIGNDDGSPVEPDETKVEYEYLLGNKETGESGDLNFTPGLYLIKNEKNAVTTDIETELHKDQNADQQYADLATLLNSMEDGSLCVSYDISLKTDGLEDDTICITNEQLEQMKQSGSTSISLSALCLIPLEFKVTDDIHMNLLKLIGTNTDSEDFDLLGRKEEPDNSQISEFAKAIRDVSIIYESSKVPFIVVPDGLEDEMSLCIDMDGNRGESEETRMDISGDTLVVRPEEVLKYPLCPSIELLIPQGKLLIPQESIFDAKIYIKIATSGEIIWLSNLKNKKEGGNE